MTIQVKDASGQPATFQGPISLNLSSNSTGEHNFLLSALGPVITSVTLQGGSPQTVVYYRDYLASNPALTALAVAAIPTPSANLGITVNPAALFQLQVLLPGQTADPGEPTTDASGRIGNPNTQLTGNVVAATLHAVDKYFNVISGNGDSTALNFSDPGVPSQSLAFASGTVSTSFVFATAGSQTLSASDLSTGGINGVSDPVSVQQGVNSNVLNVVHQSPNLSTVILGQAVTVLTFDLKVQGGSHDVQLTDLIVFAKDQTGAGIPMNSAFHGLTLVSGAQIYPLSVTGDAAVSATIPAGALTVLAGGSLSVTLIADISANASAKSAVLYVGKNSFVGNDATSPAVVLGSSTSFGDSTGFPMESQTMVFSNGDLAGTYGSYPNPFRAGQESATIEFYLQSASTVSLTLYDVMGRRIGSLLDHQSLQPGLQRIPWDGRNGSGRSVVNGVYFAQLDVNGTKLLIKVVVIK